MIGTDSHTPNAGGLGMVAIGVGGADAVDVMTGFPFNVRWPKVIGVKLTGTLSGWSSPKDVILEVARVLTVEGGTGAIVEYFGPGADSISATGKATICNMGAEIGATTSHFPYDQNMAMYLKSTGREAIADAADKVVDDLRADDGALYDQLIEIDLDELKPLINGPHSPDRAHQVGRPASARRPRRTTGRSRPSACLIGSCTNSSYEDITRVASIARQARPAGLKAKSELLITPGSEQIRATIERDGLLADLEAIGATVLANACGPCIGQWSRPESITGEPNTIVNSFNRNFPKRNDGSANTLSFVTSPDTVIALAAGRAPRLRPDDRHDHRARRHRGHARAAGRRDAPRRGLRPRREHVHRAAGRRLRRRGRGVARRATACSCSSRSRPWDGNDYLGLPVLMKAQGKCTTDHISAAGPWLKYRGHLENISGNLFARRGQRLHRRGRRGQGRHRRRDPRRTPTSPRTTARPASRGWRSATATTARARPASTRRWSHGSAAALVILARSFARIHETNAKKQGLAAADVRRSGDLRPDRRGRPHQRARPAAGARAERALPDRQARRHDASTSRRVHTFSPEQVEWFKAGSALNIVRQKVAAQS